MVWPRCFAIGCRKSIASVTSRPRSAGTSCKTGRAWYSTLFTVAESTRKPARKWMIHCRVSGKCAEASASNPVKSSMLPRGLRISCASTVATSASASARREASLSLAIRFCSVKSRRIQIASRLFSFAELKLSRKTPIIRSPSLVLTGNSNSLFTGFVSFSLNS